MAKQPVTVWGIEFDALIEETRTYQSEVPLYPVEDGYNVSDTIIKKPMELKLTLFLSNTPVTWLYRHGSSTDRVEKVCDELEEKWASRKLAKIVTNEKIYKDMAITELSICRSDDTRYSRQIELTAQKVTITERKAVLIPTYSAKSGKTGGNGGKAGLSNETQFKVHFTKDGRQYYYDENGRVIQGKQYYYDEHGRVWHNGAPDILYKPEDKEKAESTEKYYGIVSTNDSYRKKNIFKK